MAVQHYSGSCQCGAVTFEADVDLDQTIVCNCSRCQRLGVVLTFSPRDRLVIKSGADKLTTFTFNSHRVQHQFCKVCGIQPFATGPKPDGSQMAAVNVNCLDGVDPRALISKAVDGKSF